MVVVCIVNIVGVACCLYYVIGMCVSVVITVCSVVVVFVVVVCVLFVLFVLFVLLSICCELSVLLCVLSCLLWL